jgi:hypothetical protein
MHFLAVFLVLFGLLALGALEVGRRARSGRQLERSLDALRPPIDRPSARPADYRSRQRVATMRTGGPAPTPAGPRTVPRREFGWAESAAARPPARDRMAG